MATQTAIPKTKSKADSADNGHRVMYSDGLSSLHHMRPWQIDLMYPPNLEPKPDGTSHHYPFVKTILLLRRGLAMLGAKALVLGDINIYYLDEYGRRVHVAPDAFVALDLTLEDAEGYESYFVELMGKAPDFVMEMASRSTARVDLEAKRRTYAYMGIPEYWLTDPTGGQIYGAPLIGLRLVDGEYVEMELEKLPDGGLRGRSEVLGLDLYWINDDLRLRDSATGKWLLTPEEEVAARIEAEAQAQEAQAQVAELREQLRRLQG